MLVTTYKCKIISPMFLHGSDNINVEFRATPFKSMMRFWWRSFQPSLDGKLLLAEEEKLFGGIFGEIEPPQRRSPFDISVCTESVNYVEKNYLLPHKNLVKSNNKETPKDSIKVGTEFDINISIRGNNDKDNLKKKLECLFELTSVLGGVGQRSRRGAGCFKILQKDNNSFNYNGEDIVDWCYNQIKFIKHDNCTIEKNNNMLILSNLNKKEGRHISSTKSIEFIPIKPSLKVEKVLEHIGKCTHDSLKDKREDVQLALGRAIGGKIASPVYVSLTEDDNRKYVVVSRLQYSNIAYFKDDKNPRHKKRYEGKYGVLDKIQEKFIESIRNGVN
ncbi:type III-B CRISPR module RAMP protein Cmr1 [Clostridium sp. Bc-iso-3]|nr:type III-B CRISPR module RAMP protein Cmr1 [Clostridium sp. Bc-iso-3]